MGRIGFFYGRTLRRARALLRKYIPEGVNLSDELIAERRAEAARESEQRQ
jgi:hypothetical protein